MKKWMIALIGIVLLFLSACSEEQTSYETIDISEVESYQQDGYVVMDVREASEYDAGHIPGAINKPLSEISSGNFEGLDAEQSYVVICQSGNRSQQASDVLIGEGYTFVNVDQGMSSWTGEVE